MPARVPQLDTSGLDVTNAIAKGVSAGNALEQRNTLRMQNELMSEELTPEAKARRNEIRKQKHKTDLADLEAKRFEHAREGLIWAKSRADAGEEGAYAAYRKHMVETFGIPTHALPKFSSFFDIKPDIDNPTGQQHVFNKERFDKWSTDTLKTADDVFAAGDKAKDIWEHKIIYGPQGQEISKAIKIGEDYNPEDEYGVGWTFTDPNESQKGDPKPMTEAQQGSATRAEENQLVNWEKTLTDTDKDGNMSAELTDQNSSIVRMYNEKAKKLGKPTYKWTPKAYEGTEEEDEKGGLIRLPKRALEWGKKVVMGKDDEDVTLIDGWVKQSGESETKAESEVPKVSGEENTQRALELAREAISKGADPEAVMKRLKEMGIDAELKEQ